MLHLQVKAACSGATGAERTAACAVRALASVPCAWLQAHTYDLCDVLATPPAGDPPCFVLL